MEVELTVLGKNITRGNLMFIGPCVIVIVEE